MREAITLITTSNGMAISNPTAPQSQPKKQQRDKLGGMVDIDNFAQYPSLRKRTNHRSHQKYRSCGHAGHG